MSPDVPIGEMDVHECPYVGARPLGIVQAHYSIEKAYFDLVERLLQLSYKQYVTAEELYLLLASPAYEYPDPPACTCGHEFSSDPREFHLAGCAFKTYFEG